MSNHKISQETFDETLLENQDLFDLSPTDAIQETISQFQQQGITNLSSYILTSHPDSEEGKEERETRKVFGGYLEVLDQCVLEDGTVDECVTSDPGKREKVLRALDGVWNFCNLGTSEKPTKVQDGVSASTDGTGSVKKGDKYERSMAFLTLIHSTSSLFTFMSLLGVIPVQNDNDTTEDEPGMNVDHTATPPPPTKEQMIVLDKVVHLMTSILTPRKASEREIKSLIKDRFAAMERLLLLIHQFTTWTAEQNETTTDGRNDKDDEYYTCANMLKRLVALATAACRNSERNKVSFVRAFKNSKQNKARMSTIALLVRGLRVSHACAKKESSLSSFVQLLTEFCKLITILCRYDDFRPEGSAGGLGIDSSLGMNVSSSHDHVLEFNREGVVPVLHDITIMALTQNINGDDDGSEVDHSLVAEDDIVSLASSAMSATRCLAVNDEIVQSLVAVGILKVVKLALEMGVKEAEDMDTTDADVDANDSAAKIAETETVDKETKQREDRIKVHRQNLTSGAIGLIRNLCGNDGIKTSLCLGNPNDPTSASLHSVLQGMRLYRDNALIQEHGCGTLAAMALRRPANAVRIVKQNGPRELLAAMSKFPNNVLVQRQGALAIRNIASRLAHSAANAADDEAPAAGTSETKNDEEKVTTKAEEALNVRDIFLDLGAEVILRHITGRHQGSVDEAYAALRDLGCEVSMSKFDEATQTFTRKVEMFGEVKSNFRATYDDGDKNLQGKMDAMGM